MGHDVVIFSARLKPNVSMCINFDEEIVIQNESIHFREQA